MGLSCERARSIDLAAFAVDPSAAGFDGFRSHYPTCPDCAREVEGLSRLESALRGPTGKRAHPDPEALLAFEQRPETLPAPQREQISAHLEGCAPCRAELRALRGFEWPATREAHPTAAQARSPTRRPPPPQRRMRPGLLAAAVAAALLMVVALPLYLLRDTERSEPPLAVVEPEPQPVPEPVVPREPEAEALPETRVVREPVEEPELEAAPAPAAPEPEPVLVAEETPQPAPAPQAVAPPLPEPLEIAMAFPSDTLVYTPPGGSDPVLKRWRVPGVVRSGGGPGIRIQALAPDHTGRSAEPSPTLYWALSASTDLRVELVVTDEASVQPLLDEGVDGARAGIHALRLDERGIVLEPGKTYRWYATVVPDPEDRSGDVVSGGAIERVVPDAALAARLAGASPGHRAHLLAEAGLFYDALDVLSAWTAEYPEASEPRRDRAALLEAVGLGKALPPEGGHSGPG